MTVKELRDLLAAVKHPSGEVIYIALPALLDVAEAARLHDCQTTAGYSANLRARKKQPCPICDALDRLGET